MLDENKCREQFSVAYAHALASSGRCTLEVTQWDVQQIDVTFKQTAHHELKDFLSLDAQLKCTSQDVERQGGFISWRLERAHYDSLRSTRRGAPIILVVVVVPDDLLDWFPISPEEALFRARAYWVSLYDYPEIDQETITVRLPLANHLDEGELLTILGRIGKGDRP